MNRKIFKARIYGRAGVARAKCSFPHPITGEMVIFKASDDSGGWQQEVINCMQEDKPDYPLDGATFMKLTIYVSRPLAHYKAGGGLNATAPSFPKSGKNINKILRLVLDAMPSAGWIVDDSCIASLNIRHRYTSDVIEPERTEIVLGCFLK